MRLSAVARELEQQDNPADALANIVRVAEGLIPGVDEGSISVVLRRRVVISQAPSGDLPRVIDALQGETGQGPCLDAVFEHQTVRVTDMSTKKRWPKLAARAFAAGCREHALLAAACRGRQPWGVEPVESSPERLGSRVGTGGAFVRRSRGGGLRRSSQRGNRTEPGSSSAGTARLTSSARARRSSASSRSHLHGGHAEHRTS